MNDKTWSSFELKRVLLHLSDRIEVKSVTKLLVGSHYKHETLYQVIEELAHKVDLRDKLILEMFRQTYVNEQVNYSMRLIIGFESTLLN